MQWEPALCLILAWLLVYLCILRGTESTGKVGRRHGCVCGKAASAVEGQKRGGGEGKDRDAGTSHLLVTLEMASRAQSHNPKSRNEDLPIS